MPPDEELTYETISQLFQKERKVSRLTEITPDFYEEVAKYLGRLEQEYSKEYTKNPTSPTTLLLREEHLKITKLLKQIYEIRERKLILSALNHAKGATHEIKNITPQEQQLLDSVVEIILSARAPILQISQTAQGTLGRNQDLSGPPPKKPDAAPARKPKASSVGEPAPEDVAPPPEIADRGFNVAYVLEDITSFVGTDLKTYNLKREEVVCLPKNIASILLKNNKIRLLEQSTSE
jgi:DNA replication initiation complex subunit (GINS family)